MQWSNLTKKLMWFIFQHSLTCGPHSLLPSVLQRLNSRGIESLILILEKVLNCRICPHWSDTASQPSVFHVGEQKIVREVPNQKIMEDDQPVQSHSYAQQPLQPQTCVQEHCPGETGFPSSVFQAVNEMCLLLYTFQSPELLIQCGFTWKETMQLVSGEVEFIATYGVAQPLSQSMNFSAHPHTC